MILTIVPLYCQAGLILVWICRWEQTQERTYPRSNSLGVAMPVFLTTGPFPCHSQVLPLQFWPSFWKKWAPKLLGRVISKFCFSQRIQELYGLSTMLDEVNKEMNFICALCLQVLFTTDSATTNKLTSLTIDFSVFKILQKVIFVTHWHF